MKAKKSLGQNFISDPGLIYEIVEATGTGPEDMVVEIGPGRGALTFELAERAKQVIAVELDKDLIPGLRAQAALAGNVEIVNEDILQFDFGPVVEGLDADSGSDSVSPDAASGKLRIVGNLPYYITTPIIMGLLEKDVPAASMTFMVQKEVAERITSPPGSKDYGVLSISVQYYCDTEYVLDAPAEYFRPKPKVDSAVINLRPKPRSRRLLAPSQSQSPESAATQASASETQSRMEKQFFSLVKTAFVQRRKTIQNSLTGFNGLTKEQIGNALASVNIEPTRRPETLSLEEFAALTNHLQKL